ncbi:hypothetical protein [Sorangium atrum]|uniref:Uncharacterized protein n=1 Tax=Sorangium atrum TaxID=2995308 RepID=A0ABT5C8T4_9BACT|nr:hypothetical protein [Sorangium aterium]MDC0682210.1 hypothetical protein [Sorangium aterium]
MARRAARHPPDPACVLPAELARDDLGSHEDVTPQETIPGESPRWALTVRGPEARERTVGRLERIRPSAKEYAKD